jgi:hypothetical protein
MARCATFSGIQRRTCESAAFAIYTAERAGCYSLAAGDAVVEKVKSWF